MPLFKLDIEKTIQGEFWTNRYIVEQPTLAAAYDSLSFFIDVERTITTTAVTFTKARAADNVPNNDNFIVAPINLPGLRGGTASLLPLFNVVRCDFGAGFGTPSRKLLRGILRTSDIQFNNIAQALIDLVTEQYVQPLVGLGTYVDVDGQSFNIGSVYPLVSMRQLRRGSKRKTESII